MMRLKVHFESKNYHLGTEKLRTHRIRDDALCQCHIACVEKQLKATQHKCEISLITVEHVVLQYGVDFGIMARSRHHEQEAVVAADMMEVSEREHLIELIGLKVRSYHIQESIESIFFSFLIDFWLQ